MKKSAKLGLGLATGLYLFCLANICSAEIFVTPVKGVSGGSSTPSAGNCSVAANPNVVSAAQNTVGNSCSEGCKDLNWDDLNCGACGNKCEGATNSCIRDVCAAPTCGDGKKNGSEACDTGETFGHGSCNATCTSSQGPLNHGDASGRCDPIECRDLNTIYRNHCRWSIFSRPPGLQKAARKCGCNPDNTNWAPD